MGMGLEGLLVFVEVEFLDFVKEGFVADLKDFGCLFAVPARLLYNRTYQLPFCFLDSFLLDFFEWGKGLLLISLVIFYNRLLGEV